MIRSANTILLLVVAAACRAGDGEVTFYDGAGDAMIRRTDAGNDGSIRPGTVLPDILSVRLAAWQADDPADDPYTGQVDDDSGAHLVRIDVTVVGLVNPPGPLGLNGEPFDPFAYGDSPIYGYIDLDMDDEKNTGGEFDPIARKRFLGNTSRFGSRPEGSIGERAAVSGGDYDSDLETDPEYERSGQDWAVAFCGCFSPTVVSRDGDQDDLFEAGETWVVQGRFLPRAGAYQCASAMEGGSDFGLYDPLINVRFRHVTGTDTTTITIVYPLDMAGAALLADHSEEEMDYRADNDTSIAEGLWDVIEGAQAGGLTSDCRTLVDGWRDEDVSNALDPSEWTCTVLIGTSYATAAPDLFVWTDIGFGCTTGDLDGDGEVNALDEQHVFATVAAMDGGPEDGDGRIDGSVCIINFAYNFHLADTNYDGVIDAADAMLTCTGDCDADGVCDAQEADCDADGVPDDCDNDPDCDVNGVPDTCEMVDCNANGILDACDPDCDGNGFPDECDLTRLGADCNANGVLDACEVVCPADLAPPVGILNIFDFLAFQTAFGEASPCADLAPPWGNLNIFDFLAFQTAFGEGC